MVKSGKSFVKIESRFQIALFFLFYQTLRSLPPFRLFQALAYKDPPFIQEPRVS